MCCLVLCLSGVVQALDICAWQNPDGLTLTGTNNGPMSITDNVLNPISGSYTHIVNGGLASGTLADMWDADASTTAQFTSATCDIFVDLMPGLDLSGPVTYTGGTQLDEIRISLTENAEDLAEVMMFLMVYNKQPNGSYGWGDDYTYGVRLHMGTFDPARYGYEEGPLEITISGFDPAKYSDVGRIQLEFQRTIYGSSLNTIVNDVAVKMVPEPATISLLGIGLITLLKRRK
jgi:hypothetical protein